MAEKGRVAICAAVASTLVVVWNIHTYWLDRHRPSVGARYFPKMVGCDTPFRVSRARVPGVPMLQGPLILMLALAAVTAGRFLPVGDLGRFRRELAGLRVAERDLDYEAQGHIRAAAAIEEEVNRELDRVWKRHRMDALIQEAHPHLPDEATQTLRREILAALIDDPGIRDHKLRVGIDLYNQARAYTLQVDDEAPREVTLDPDTEAFANRFLALLLKERAGGRSSGLRQQPNAGQ